MVMCACGAGGQQPPGETVQVREPSRDAFGGWDPLVTFASSVFAMNCLIFSESPQRTGPSPTPVAGLSLVDFLESRGVWALLFEESEAAAKWPVCLGRSTLLHLFCQQSMSLCLQIQL